MAAPCCTGVQATLRSGCSKPQAFVGAHSCYKTVARPQQRGLLRTLAYRKRQVTFPLRAQADQLEAVAVSEDLASQSFKIAEEVAEDDVAIAHEEASSLDNFPVNGVEEDGFEDAGDVILLGDEDDLPFYEEPNLKQKLPPPPKYRLNVLWLEKNVALAVDQVFNENQWSPLTEFFFWPRKDAWEELKTALESRPWISERDKVLLLNKATEVITYWQDADVKHSIAEAREKFSDVLFQGS